jgi:hypothetical protein
MATRPIKRNPPPMAKPIILIGNLPDMSAETSVDCSCSGRISDGATTA